MPMCSIKNITWHTLSSATTIISCEKYQYFPRNLFIMYLVQLITDSIESGLEAILTFDTNGHVVKGKLSRHLQNLGIVEAYR